MNKRLIIVLGSIFLAIVLLVLGIKNKSTGSYKPTSNSQAAYLSQAEAHLEKGELQEARIIYKQLVDEFPGSSQIANWQEEIEDLNMRLLYSPIITERSLSYTIKPGDTLSKIAKKFTTTVELIKKSNNITSDKIIPGRKLKIWAQAFSVVIDKSQNILILKSDEEVIKTYVVSTGNNNSTPTGNFKVINKLINPPWFKAGGVVAPDNPENILGSRWIGIDLPGYGIHGTRQPGDLGKQVTQGCIRMSNPDVEELYTILPFGAEVVIID